MFVCNEIFLLHLSDCTIFSWLFRVLIHYLNASHASENALSLCAVCQSPCVSSSTEALCNERQSCDHFHRSCMRWAQHIIIKITYERWNSFVRSFLLMPYPSSMKYVVWFYEQFFCSVPYDVRHLNAMLCERQWFILFEEDPHCTWTSESKREAVPATRMEKKISATCSASLAFRQWYIEYERVEFALTHCFSINWIHCVAIIIIISFMKVTLAIRCW